MAKDQKPIQYKVEITPLESQDTYGTTINVSNYIEVSGVSKIRRSIDATDFDIGIFKYDDLKLKGVNENGIFNDQNDRRSIFPAGRDRAKVKVTFIQFDKADFGAETTTIRYEGLINEESTRINPISDSISFRVLSVTSVIRNTKVPAGAVSSGQTIKAAMLAILNIPRITSVLGVSSANINPDLNITIDDGSQFSNKPAREALNELMLVSNSVMLIDSSNNVIIKSRAESTANPTTNLFGKHDLHRRENIISIASYNTGLHRMFTSVSFNGTVRDNTANAEEFGSRQKAISYPWITDATKEAQIAARLLDEFDSPKIELKVTVATSLVKDVQLLDQVSINYPTRQKPQPGTFLPVVGITEIGDTGQPLPDRFGSTEIDRTISFKIMEIAEKPQTFETVLKLRQSGTALNDGVFNKPGNSIVGFAVIGEGIVQQSTDACATWNPSVVGAALVGCTEVA